MICMTIIDLDNTFQLISVLDLELPSQNTVIPPRAFHVLSLRLKGDAQMQIGDTQITLQDNDISHCSSNCTYHILSGMERVILINFRMPGNSSEAIGKIQKLRPTNPVIFQRLFMSLLEVWTTKKPGYYWKSMSIFYRILENITLQTSPASTEIILESLKNALDYLHLNYTDRNLSVAKLCQIASLSDTQFRKKFYQIYSTTPLDYINTLRVNYAADLLTNTAVSIEDISQAAGFSDSKYFSTVFKKYKKMMPSQFRKLN